MRGKRIILAGMAASVITGVIFASANVRGQLLRPRHGSMRPSQSSNAAQAQPKFAHPPFSLPRMADFTGPPGAQVFPVYIDSEMNLDPTTQALYQQMATTLTGYAVVPNDRTNYFSALNNNPDFQFNYWTGVVLNVQAVAGGNLVTVGVDPVFTNRASVLTPCDYSEQYLVGNDGSITYQGFSDPNGYAGQMPTANDL
jgi:hypothetical protein